MFFSPNAISAIITGTVESEYMYTNTSTKQKSYLPLTHSLILCMPYFHEVQAAFLVV